MAAKEEEVELKLATPSSPSPSSPLNAINSIRSSFLNRSPASPRNHDMVHCPTIVNMSPHSIVVFQERGFLYNKQTLAPGEVLNISRMESGAFLIPYQLHVVVGDERTVAEEHFRKQSRQTLIRSSAIPVAFCVGTLLAASSAGTLAGPAAALGPMVSGLVVRGVVIDSAALAAGAVMASRAAFLAEFLVKQHPDNFMVKTSSLRPGKRIVVVTGGVADALKVDVNVSEEDYRKLELTRYKTPEHTLKDQLHFYLPGVGKQKQKQQQASDGISVEIVASEEEEEVDEDTDSQRQLQLQLQEEAEYRKRKEEERAGAALAKPLVE